MTVLLGLGPHQDDFGSVDLAFEGEFTRFSNLIQPYQQGAAADFD